MGERARPSFQFSLKTITLGVVGVGIVMGLVINAVKKAKHSSIERRALESVWDRDGFTQESEGGFIEVELNGGTIRIGDKSLYDIRHLNRVSIIKAHKTEITNRGIEYLMGHSHLRELDLSSSPQINDGAIPSLSKLTTLEKLVISNTGISKGGAQRLHNALTMCEIVY